MIALLALVLAAPQDGPSFDCARASTMAEHAICADPALGRLDRRVAQRYVAVRRAMSPAAREALARDQRWFLGARDEWRENSDRGGFNSFPNLTDRLTGRIAFLDSLRTRPSNSLIGVWRNVAGEAEIRSAGPGRMTVAFNAAHPVNARWLCEVSVEGPLTGRTVEGIASDDPPYRVRAILRDGYLEIEEEAVDETSDGPPYCGANGHVSGVYFRVG